MAGPGFYNPAMGSAHRDRVTAAWNSLDAPQRRRSWHSSTPCRRPVAVQSLPGRWTPAGHASHVALTNDVFFGVLEGGGPIAAFAGQSEFPDDKWSMDAPPRGVVAPGILIPAPGIGRAAAAAQLRASAARLRPAIASLDEKRAALCVRLPWNVVSLYQMSEWAGGHTLRHLAQVNRDLQLRLRGFRAIDDPESDRARSGVTGSSRGSAPAAWAKCSSRKTRRSAAASR